MPFCREGIRNCVPGSGCGALVGLQRWHTISCWFFLFYFFSIFSLWPHEPVFNRQSSSTFSSPIGLDRDPSPAAELIGTPFLTEFHTESYMCNQNYFSPAVRVALHQALNFTCCLIAQLGVILPPFSCCWISLGVISPANAVI